jgi:hypothetical protein
LQKWLPNYMNATEFYFENKEITSVATDTFVGLDNLLTLRLSFNQIFFSSKYGGQVKMLYYMTIPPFLRSFDHSYKWLRTIPPCLRFLETE